MRDLDLVSTYLHFGYLPAWDHGTAELLSGLVGDGRRPCDAAGDDPGELVAAGVDALRRAFRDTVKETDAGRLHVVPLSGGLDSRAVLAGLLENLDSDKIRAVTFGTPGTWDYEIGRQVARAAGVRFESIDLSADEWRWSTEDLLHTAMRTEPPVWLFDAHVNRTVPERYGEECVYWSGFMGDPLAGSHLLDEDSESWDVAKSRFVQRNRLARSLRLTPPGFDPTFSLPAESFLSPDLLCYDEQLDFAVRQQCRVRQIVLPSDYVYQAPFLNPTWSRFILGVPRKQRENQLLYKEILRTAYPELMSLPTKGNIGLPRGAPAWRRLVPAGRLRIHAAMKRYAPRLYLGVSPSTNYIDFDRGLRTRSDLKRTVHENLEDLKRRDIVTWLDIDEIWQRHQRRRRNHADALLLLASLEICFKAGRFG